MSRDSNGLGDPQWDLADRLAKSLRVSGVSVQEMADELGVHRNSVSSWLHGRAAPSTRHLKIWAELTGVRHQWLKGDGTSIRYIRARDDGDSGKSSARPHMNRHQEVGGTVDDTAARFVALAEGDNSTRKTNQAVAWIEIDKLVA